MPQLSPEPESTQHLSRTRVFFASINRLGWRISVLLLVLLFCKTGGAYILQGPHLLRLMAENMGSTKSLQVFQRLVIYNDSVQDGLTQVHESLRYILPEAFRSEITTEDTQQIQVVASGAALKIIDGKIIAETEIGLDRYKDLLLYRSPALIERLLVRFGVDVSVSSLGRFQGKIAYVVGATYPDQSMPQLWIDKDDLRPLRWLIHDTSAPSEHGLLDIRYTQWRKFNRIWYPMRVEIYQNDLLIREIRVDKVLVNPSFSKQLFDIGYLKSIYPTAAPPEPAGRESQGVNEVQETIERFRKIFE